MKNKELEWILIEAINWPIPLKSIEKSVHAFIEKHGKDVWEALNCFVKYKVGQLQRAIKKYEEENGILDIGSDDGFSDVTHHIVGLGEKEFKKCIADPRLVEKRYNSPYGSPEGYKESFAYFFLLPSSMDLENIQNLDSKLSELHDVQELMKTDMAPIHCITERITSDTNKVLDSTRKLTSDTIKVLESIQNLYSKLSELHDVLELMEKDLTK